MTPRLVATDLDGTIVRPDGTISDRTLAALRLAEAAGATVVFVTGRPPRMMAEIAAASRHDGLAICSNGAFEYVLSTGRVVAERAIPGARAAEAARRLREGIPGIGLAVEYASTVAADAHYEPWDWDYGSDLYRAGDAELFAGPVPKLLGRHPTLSNDELLTLARPLLAGLVNVYHANGLRLIEAVGPGVSKAAAVAELAGRLGLGPAEVIAFGDMPNDLPVLSWAGTSYGVAGAHPEVLAAVDHVIGAVEADGVAEILESIYA